MLRQPADVLTDSYDISEGLISLSVTDHSRAEWIARQITEALPWDEASTHLVVHSFCPDRDTRDRQLVRRWLAAMRMRDHPISSRFPWTRRLCWLRRHAMAVLGRNRGRHRCICHSGVATIKFIAHAPT